MVHEAYLVGPVKDSVRGSELWHRLFCFPVQHKLKTKITNDSNCKLNGKFFQLKTKMAINSLVWSNHNQLRQQMPPPQLFEIAEEGLNNESSRKTMKTLIFKTFIEFASALLVKATRRWGFPESLWRLTISATSSLTLWTPLPFFRRSSLATRTFLKFSFDLIAFSRWGFCDLLGFWSLLTMSFEVPWLGCSTRRVRPSAKSQTTTTTRGTCFSFKSNNSFPWTQLILLLPRRPMWRAGSHANLWRTQL